MNKRCVQNGWLQVVTENTPFKGGYVGINSFGFGGSNTHVILHAPAVTPADSNEFRDDIPKVIHGDATPNCISVAVLLCTY